MTNSGIKFTNLDWAEECLRISSKPSQDAATAFTDFMRDGVGGGFAIPMHTLRYAINWAWVRWYADSKTPTQLRTGSISELLSFAVRRGIGLYSLRRDIPVDLPIRSDHDCFLMQAAVLSGDVNTMQEAADTITPADPALDKYQYQHAWCGILRARIQGDAAAETEQLAVWKKYKPARVFAWPVTAVVESFVARDYRKLDKALGKVAEKYTQRVLKEKTATLNAEGQMVVNAQDMVLGSMGYFIWPYPEAVFAKLAVLDGAEIVHDSPWLPMAFIRALASDKTA